MNTKPLKWLIAIALAVRLLVYLWQVVYPVSFNSTLQNFADFSGYYQWQLSLLAQGHLPYRDFAYSYPPLFIYVLYPFYQLGSNFAALPIVLADALTGPLIYLIVQRAASQRIAVASCLAYVFSPFFLTYEGLAWLSEQPMLLFLLLSLYLLMVNRTRSSALAFGIALMLKQDAVFILPFYLIWVAKNQGAVRAAKSFSLIAGFALLVSGPFLILFPLHYLGAVTFGVFPGLPTILPPLLAPTSGPFTGGGPPLGLNTSIPAMTCSVVGNNIFGLSQSCLGILSGRTISNFVVILPSGAVEETLTSFALILLIPLFPEYVLILRQSRPTLFLAAGSATFLVPLMLFSKLEVYKYYLLPVYALLLASSDDVATLGISTVFPLIALLNPISYFTELLPLIEIQFLMLYWRLKNPHSHPFAEAENRERVSRDSSMSSYRWLEEGI